MAATKYGPGIYVLRNSQLPEAGIQNEAELEGFLNTLNPNDYVVLLFLKGENSSNVPLFIIKERVDVDSLRPATAYVLDVDGRLVSRIVYDSKEFGEVIPYRKSVQGIS